MGVLTILVLLASCSDTMDDKADIDAKYDSGNATTVTLNADNIVYNGVTLNIGYSDPSQVYEAGYEMSSSSDMSDPTYVVIQKATDSTSISSTYTQSVPLTPGTTYYVRSYAFQRNGSTVYSEVATVTTPEYIYPLNGTYSVTEYQYNQDTEKFEAETNEDGSPYTYDVTVEFEEGSTTDVKITNILGFGTEVEGIYDPDEKLVYIESPASNPITIGNHNRYGTIYCRSINSEFSAYVNNIIFQFDEKKGTLNTTTILNPIVSAGSFGYFQMECQHK